MAIRAWLHNEASSRQRERELRRRVSLEVAGRSASGDAVAITVHNISATGLLLECEEGLAINSVLQVDLPGAPDARAIVRWTSGRLSGCQFEEPLERATLSAVQLRSAVADPGAGLGESLSWTSEPLAVRLQKLRKLRGLTLAELSRSLGVSKPTVWAWEQGRTAPTPDRYDKIAEVLGTTVFALRSGQDRDGASAVLEKSRRQIAEAYRVDPGAVRIMIELQ